MISYFNMAWWLAYEELYGNLDEEYPMISTDFSPEHSTSWYDYKRNDPNRENPFTDPKEREYADKITGEYIYESPDGGTTVTRRKFGDDIENKEVVCGDYFDDRYPYVQDYLADNDDQAAHHFISEDYTPPSPFIPKTLNNEVQQEKETMTAHYFKYHEEEILNDIESYVSGTYRGHYTGNTHEYRNVQTLDLMAARDVASGFCQANILKYGSRYGSKDGRNKKDLLKVIHYAMLLLHFDEHYGKPSTTSGNIDHNMP